MFAKLLCVVVLFNAVGCCCVESLGFKKKTGVETGAVQNTGEIKTIGTPALPSTTTPTTPTNPGNLKGAGAASRLPGEIIQ